MLQCFEMIKINSLTVRSIRIHVHSSSSGLIAWELHTCMAHALLGVVVEGSSLAEVWAEEAVEELQFFQYEELLVQDSPHHLYGVSFLGVNPSDLAADCPLTENGYPMHICDLAGMLSSAYKNLKLFVYSLTATGT